MLQHLLLVRYRNPGDVGEDTRARINAGCRDLAARIPEIARVDCGHDLGLLEENAHFGLRIVFGQSVVSPDFSGRSAMGDALDRLLLPLAESSTAAWFEGADTSVEPAGERYHVSVDPELCQGHAVCEAEAPEIFELREVAGRPYPLSHVLQAEVGEALLEKARTAERYCPTRAIRVRKLAKEAQPAGSVQHLCLIRYRDPAAVTPAIQANIEEIYRHFADLVPGLLHMDVGRNVSGDREDSDLVIRADFSDKEAFLAYSVHPDHYAVLFPVLGPHMESWASAQIGIR